MNYMVFINTYQSILKILPDSPLWTSAFQLCRLYSLNGTTVWRCSPVTPKQFKRMCIR